MAKKISDPISLNQRFLVPNNFCWDPKLFWIKMFLGKKKLFQPIFFYRNIFSKISFTKNFLIKIFLTKFFLNQKCFWPKILLANFFFWDIKIWVELNLALFVKLTQAQLKLILVKPFIRPSSRLTVSAWVSPSSTPACLHWEGPIRCFSSFFIDIKSHILIRKGIFALKKGHI